MDPKLRVVTQWPLKVLWDEDGHDLNARRVRELGADDIRDILRSGRAVPFVLVVHQLKWLRGDDRFEFWRNDLLPHLHEPNDPRKYLEEFPDEWFYLATEWRWEGEDTPFCIVCEQYH